MVQTKWIAIRDIKHKKVAKQKLHPFRDEFGKAGVRHRIRVALGFAVRPLERMNDGAELFAIDVGYHPLVHSAV